MTHTSVVLLQTIAKTGKFAVRGFLQPSAQRSNLFSDVFNSDPALPIVFNFQLISPSAQLFWEKLDLFLFFPRSVQSLGSEGLEQ